MSTAVILEHPFRKLQNFRVWHLALLGAAAGRIQRAWRLLLARQYGRYLMALEWSRQMNLAMASQRIVRGFLARRRFANYMRLRRAINATKIQCMYRSWKARKVARRQHRYSVILAVTGITCESLLPFFLLLLPLWDLCFFLSFIRRIHLRIERRMRGAMVIQRFYRGWLVRLAHMWNRYAAWIIQVCGELLVLPAELAFTPSHLMIIGCAPPPCA